MATAEMAIPENTANVSRPMTLRTLRPFLAITFGLTWGLAAFLILFTDQIEAIFGEISMTNPLFILAVYAPGFAAYPWCGATTGSRVSEASSDV